MKSTSSRYCKTDKALGAIQCALERGTRSNPVRFSKMRARAPRRVETPLQGVPTGGVDYDSEHPPLAHSLRIVNKRSRSPLFPVRPLGLPV